jgi:hypothetical protein
MRLQKKNPLSEAFLAENSGQGTDGAALLPVRLERYGRAHQRALRMADYARVQGEDKLAGKVARCGEYLVFRHYFTIDKVRLHAAEFCKKHLLCPLCAIRRGAKSLRAYLEKLELVLLDHPGLQAYMVSLTVVDGPDLQERFIHLRNAMKRMAKARRNFLGIPNRPHVEFARAVGGLHSIEVKRGKNSGLWHPHVHMIWLCYEQPDQAKLSVEWKQFTGDSFIVDVRPFYDQDDVVSGFLEVFKYALKFSDLELEDNWDAFTKLAGNRLVDAFGVLRGVEVRDDLTDEPLDDLPYVELFYRYMSGAGYSLGGVSGEVYPDNAEVAV